MSDDRTRTALLADLQDASPHVRCRAALHLATAPDPALEEVLVQSVVRERDPLVRDMLTRAVASSSDAVVPRLITRLGDRDADVRQHAAHVLGKRADAGATDALIDAVADDDPAVVCKVVFALGRIQAPRSIPVLVRALGHRDDRVRRACRDALEGFGVAAVPAMLAALPHGDIERRRQIAYLLGAVADPRALPVLATLLADADAPVRFAALHALTTADPGAAAAGAAALREDPDAAVRALAARVGHDT